MVELQIGRNLASAQRNLRPPNKIRTLWIDAVCINQQDDNERGLQTQRIADIYHLAHRVVVWLGLKAQNSRLALQTLEYLGKQLEPTTGYLRGRSPEAIERDWFYSWSILPYTEDTWVAIHKIVRRPWFERLWILQEIQLANIHAFLTCGYESILWSHYRRALICLCNKVDLPYSTARAVGFPSVHGMVSARTAL